MKALKGIYTCTQHLSKSISGKHSHHLSNAPAVTTLQSSHCQMPHEFLSRLDSIPVGRRRLKLGPTTGGNAENPLDPARVATWKPLKSQGPWQPRGKTSEPHSAGIHIFSALLFQIREDMVPPQNRIPPPHLGLSNSSSST